MSKKDVPHLRIRIEPAMLVRLEKSAEKNDRTLTGEIVHRLSESFAKDDLTDVLDKLSDKLTVKINDIIVKQGRG